MGQQIKKTFFSAKNVFMTFFALIFCINAFGQDIWAEEEAKALAIVSEDIIMKDIVFLSDSLCQGRATGSQGNIEAGQMIARRFEESGLTRIGESWESEFHVRRGTKGKNIIGILPGAYTLPCERYIIIGAHYDHIGTLGGKLYPGADANASGVAAMTALAQIFGEMRKMGKIFNKNLIFVAFDAKEHDFLGSTSLWNMIEYGRLKNPVTGESITKDKIDLMVNIDQIGCTLSPIRKERKDYLIMLGTPSLPKAQRGLLNKCNTESGTGLDIALDYYGSANFTKVFYRLSDQRIFVDNKIPAVLFTSGITMNTNKVWDSPETIDRKIMLKRTKLIYHWLSKML